MDRRAAPSDPSPRALLVGVAPHHFSISVPDMSVALTFWENIFGFAVEHQFEIASLGAHGAFLKGPGIKLELWSVTGAAPVPAERQTPNSDLRTCGTKHIAFSVPDLQNALESLLEHGVTISAVQRRATEPMAFEQDPRLHPGDERPRAFASFITDPAGTLIELLQA